MTAAKRFIAAACAALLLCVSLAACDNGSCKADGSFANLAAFSQKGGGGGGGHGSGGGGHAAGEGSSGSGAHEGVVVPPIIPHAPISGGHACQKGT